MYFSLPKEATPGFKKWKESHLKRLGIISESKKFEALKLELRNDDFSLKFLTPEEIDVGLKEHYESQQVGRRKLSNIKARIILNKIENLIIEAEALYTKSKERLYQMR